MTSPYPWYEVVEDESLEQGDIFLSCQVLEPALIKLGTSATEFEMQAIVKEYDIVVLSQSCDLVQGKLETVLVSPHWPITDFETSAGDFFRSSKGKEEIRRGNVPGLHMLAQCDLPSFASPVRVVSFRQVFGIPLDYLIDLASQDSDRLRLLPPYREHLAQAFARFIMRVGLPVDIQPFKK